MGSARRLRRTAQEVRPGPGAQRRLSLWIPGPGGQALLALSALSAAKRICGDAGELVDLRRAERPIGFVRRDPMCAVRRDTGCKTVNGQPADRSSIDEELERARADLHLMVDRATSADLRRRTAGARWTNQQRFWHMAFGYLIVSRLLGLVRLVGRLPTRQSRLCGAAERRHAAVPSRQLPRSVDGALVFHRPRLTRILDRTINRLQHSLDAESDEALSPPSSTCVSGNVPFHEV